MAPLGPPSCSDPSSEATEDAPGGDNDAASTQPSPLQPPSHAGESLDKLQGTRVTLSYGSSHVSDVLDVLKLLKDVDVFGCVVSINALRYYGAGRVAREWDICVPTSRLEEAVHVVANDDKYERAEPSPPNYGSVKHLNSRFQLKGQWFYFLLTPSSRCFFDPRPENCETSKGVPYPTMPHFAQSLLALQYGPDVTDFVDGMNLDKEWGRENIDFADLQVKGMEFARLMNAELVADGRTASFYTDINFQKQWDNVTTTKESRIEPMKQGRYKTRWRRIKNDTDPRERNRPF